MIAAAHNQWADRLFGLYLNRLLSRHFYAVHLLGEPPKPNPDNPLLLLPNHCSWWDGFFIYFLNRKILYRKPYLMMLEDQLQKNRFFKYLGAYSIEPQKQSDLKNKLQYTTDLLNNGDGSILVCIFPQGELLPWHQRPLIIKRGIPFLTQQLHKQIDLCYLGIRIEFGNQQRPEIFLKFSPVKQTGPGESIHSQQIGSELEQLLDQVQTEIASGCKGKLLFSGKKSINDRNYRLRRRTTS